jgi:hypothetical protein
MTENAIIALPPALFFVSQSRNDNIKNTKYRNQIEIKMFSNPMGL